MFAPSFRLSTFDSRLCGCAILILNARSQQSLHPSRCKFPMALKMKKSLATPLECTLTRKGARKSFGIHSYKFKGLKLPWNDIVTKNAGWGGTSEVEREENFGATFALRFASTEFGRSAHSWALGARFRYNLSGCGSSALS